MKKVSRNEMLTMVGKAVSKARDMKHMFEKVGTSDAEGIAALHTGRMEAYSAVYAALRNGDTAILKMDGE